MKFLSLQCVFITLILILSNQCIANTEINSFYVTTEIDTTKSSFPASGDRSVSLDVRPVISFIGNMFNGSTNNSLYISSQSILYRKFRDNNTVKRYRLNLTLSSQNEYYTQFTNYPGYLLNGSVRFNNFNVAFATGNEKRLHYKNVGLYYGSEFMASLSHQSNIHNFDYNAGSDLTGQSYLGNFERTTNSQIQTDLGLGIIGLLGAEYNISKLFFVNFEFSFPFVVNVIMINPDKTEVLTLSQETQKIEITKNKVKDPKFLWGASFSSNQLMQFRAGVVF